MAILVVLVFSKVFYLASLQSYYTFYLIQTFGVSVQTSQVLLFVFLAAVAAGTYAGGPIGDRYGRKFVIWLSILGVLPFTLLLPHLGLVGTAIDSVCIGLVLSSAFSAIVVYAQELTPGNVGAVAGLFFGLSFGLGGIGAAALGFLADKHQPELRLQCLRLPAGDRPADLFPADLRARRLFQRPTTPRQGGTSPAMTRYWAARPRSLRALRRGRAWRSSRASARPCSRRDDAAGRRRDAARSVASIAGGADRRPAGRAASERQHHARLRLSPSRWAILPSVRSADARRREQGRRPPCGDSRQEAIEPGPERRPQATDAACTRLRSRRARGSRRRSARPRPGNRRPRRTSGAPRRGERAASARSAAAVGVVRRQPKPKAVLKCAPERTG